MKNAVVLWSDAKNEGAQEVLQKLENTINQLSETQLFLFKPLLDVIEEYKKQYK